MGLMSKQRECEQFINCGQREGRINGHGCRLRNGSGGERVQS